MEKWKNYNAVFECDKINADMLKYSPWSGHRRFGYDYIANVKPKRVVELGSFYGCSMFAFAQAVKDMGLDTELWAVDLWDLFDEFTKQDYTEDVYGAFVEVKEACYGERVKMLKMSFDDALDKFEDKSIDLLHIDGSHFYDDVKHDFESWLPKLTDDATVLFHDVSDEIINGSIMGSHVFWQEIKKAYPYTAEFDHSCGLGILFMSERAYGNIYEGIDFELYKKISVSENVALKDDMRKMSFRLRDLSAYKEDLLKQKDVLMSHLDGYKADEEKKDAYIAELLKEKDVLLSHLDGYKADEEKKDAYIKELEAGSGELRSAIDDYERRIADMNKIISDFEQEKENIRLAYENTQRETVTAYEDEIKKVKSAYNAVIEEKDRYIAGLEAVKEMYEKTVSAKVKKVYHKVKGDER